MVTVHKLTGHKHLHTNAYVQKIANKLEESNVPTMKSGLSTISAVGGGGGGGGSCFVCHYQVLSKLMQQPYSCIFHLKHIVGLRLCVQLFNDTLKIDKFACSR
jgi:hypothetical protein